MKNCHLWMLAACLGMMALLLLLPVFGVDPGGAGILVPLLMLGCCVLPMLAMMRLYGSGESGGCCESDEAANAEPGREAGKSRDKSPRCH